MNETSIRTFVAIKIPVTTSLRELRANLNRQKIGAPLEREELLHLTLKFLGETPLELVPAISNLLEEVACSEAAFELPLHGIGAFPNLQRPSILWIGMRNQQPLLRLARELESRLEALGFTPEVRPYHPHVTLLRLRSRPPEFVFSLLEQHARTNFGTVAVHTVELFQSELLPAGPRYTVLASTPLGKA